MADIKLTQAILGMQPYVLIEADTDPADGELVLKIDAGGGAAEEVGVLPFLMLTQLPAEQNPLTQAIAEYVEEYPTWRYAIEKFAEKIGVPMPGASA